MKLFLRFVVLAAVLCVITRADAQDFPGVEQAMPRGTFDASGMSKLTPEERARLDDFIRSYVQAARAEAEKVGSDRAVKENKVATMPQVIQSRIVGTFSGYDGRTRFPLENGQVWAQAQPETRRFPPVESPPVLILKGRIGYRMYIAGGSDIRVTRVR